MPRTQSDDDRAGGDVGANPPRNPFERRIDRIERTATAVLVLLFAVTVPLAIYLGGQLHDVGASAIAEHKENSYQAKATLLGAPEGADSGGHSGRPVYLAPAEWLDQSSQTTTGDIPVRPSARSGETVTVWIDRNDGKVVEAPLDDATPAVAGVAAAFSILLTSAGIFGVGLITVRQRTNDVRMREWEEDWSRVEPLWSRRRDAS